MKTPKTRPLDGESDLGAIVELLNACEVVDRLEQWTSKSELLLEFNDPSVNKAKDFLLWEDDEGKLIGFSQVWVSPQGEENDGSLWFRVRPEARGGNVEEKIIVWGEQRMREVATERGASVKLRSWVRDKQRDRRALLENSGFTSDRYFIIMGRSLSELIPESKLSEGFILRQSQGEPDAEAWVEMRNQSCIDHWNYHPSTVEEHVHWLGDPNYQSELDLIAVAPDGTFVAFCLCYILPEENERNERKDGWIGSLGTRRGFRRRGLGRAMLLAGMQRLKAVGMETAKLGVDAQNPNQASKLYESVGFRKLYTNVVYVKNL
jgi:mycothiol synthase